jgi:methyl acetate hydrolase
LYGTTRDYLKFLQAILKCSPTYHSPPSNPLISQTAFKALFTPALETPKAIESLCQMMRGQFYHHPTPTPQNVQHSPGLALYLEDGEWGRKKGSGCWNGALKTVFWIDPTTGIAAECNTNILCPSNDNIVGRTITEFERTLYENLAT